VKPIRVNFQRISLVFCIVVIDRVTHRFDNPRRGGFRRIIGVDHSGQSNGGQDPENQDHDNQFDKSESATR
jgi:hypothetical protein